MERFEEQQIAHIVVSQAIALLNVPKRKLTVSIEAGELNVKFAGMDPIRQVTVRCGTATEAKKKELLLKMQNWSRIYPVSCRISVVEVLLPLLL